MIVAPLTTGSTFLLPFPGTVNHQCKMTDLALILLLDVYLLKPGLLIKKYHIV